MLLFFFIQIVSKVQSYADVICLYCCSVFLAHAMRRTGSGTVADIVIPADSLPPLLKRAWDGVVIKYRTQGRGT